MFVTYAQSGSGQNVRSCPTAVETCSCRFILLSFHETRARESLSLSLKPSAREAKCCSFRWLLSFFSALGCAVNKAAVVVAGDGSSAGVAVLVVVG